MKVLIVSDTHGHDENLEKILKKCAPFDALIHCGDGEGHEDYIASIAGCPIYMVRGNNDFFSNLEKEMEFELGGHRILLTHGHYYGVSMGPERIMEEGLERGVDLVMYGHTHKPELIRDENITILNPGSLSFPRQEGRKPSYMIMEIKDNKKIDFTLKYC